MQLELVNREENFNQRFGGGPSVGVLDPLAFGKNRVSQWLNARADAHLCLSLELCTPMT